MIDNQIEMVEIDSNEKIILAVEGVIVLLLIGLSVYFGVCYSSMENPTVSSASDNHEYLMKNVGYLVGMIFSAVVSFIMMFLCYIQYKRTYPIPTIV
jgi:hypothetical protein